MTGSGAAQSLRPVCVAARERARDGMGVACRIRTGVPGMKLRRPDHWTNTTRNFHFGCALARAIPSDAASRCTRPGVLPRTSRAAYTWKLRDGGVRGHTRSERTNKKARILCGIRASGVQSAAGASGQTRLPPGSGRSSDSRCPGACPRPGGTTHANAHVPTRAWALRRAFRLFTMGVLVRFRFEVPRIEQGSRAALRAKNRRLSKRQGAV